MSFPAPKNILNTNDRFTDYVGNGLFSLGIMVDMAKRKQEHLPKAQELWISFFKRVEVFIQHGFTEEGKITNANLQKLLQLSSLEPLAGFEQLQNLYYEIVH